MKENEVPTRAEIAQAMKDADTPDLSGKREIISAWLKSKGVDGKAYDMVMSDLESYIEYTGKANTVKLNKKNKAKQV